MDEAACMQCHKASYQGEVTVTLMIGEQTTPGVNTVLSPPIQEHSTGQCRARAQSTSVQLDAPSFPATLDTFVYQAQMSPCWVSDAAQASGEEWKK